MLQNCFSQIDFLSCPANIYDCRDSRGKAAVFVTRHKGDVLTVFQSAEVVHEGHIQPHVLHALSVTLPRQASVMNTDRLSTAQRFVTMALSRHQSQKGGGRCSHGCETQPSQLARRCVMQFAVSGCRAVGDVASTRMDVVSSL